MIRLLALVLLLANLLAFSWLQGWLDPWVPSGREPLRVSRQVAPQTVQLIPASELEAQLERIAARCFQYALLDEPTLERIKAWTAPYPGIRVESTPGRLRLRLPTEATDAELTTRRDEVSLIAGRGPDRCAP